VSDRRSLNPGDSTVFTTRPIGLRTTLFCIPWPPDPSAFQPTISWHIILCCQPDHVTNAVSTDISAAAGALVTVRNLASDQQAQVWTDYI